jgi:hypothetical protein
MIENRRENRFVNLKTRATRKPGLPESSRQLEGPCDSEFVTRKPALSQVPASTLLLGRDELPALEPRAAGRLLRAAWRTRLRMPTVRTRLSAERRPAHRDLRVGDGTRHVLASPPLRALLGPGPCVQSQLLRLREAVPATQAGPGAGIGRPSSRMPVGLGCAVTVESRSGQNAPTVTSSSRNSSDDDQSVLAAQSQSGMTQIESGDDSDTVARLPVAATSRRPSGPGPDSKSRLVLLRASRRPQRCQNSKTPRPKSSDG